MNKRAYTLDTETTGKEGSQYIEIAHARMTDALFFEKGTEFHSRYKPGVPIEFGAMAVHGIIDEDLVDCPPHGSYTLPEDCGYLIGHNVAFDWNIIGAPENIKLIDTLPLSKLLFNDQDSHTQMACLFRIDKKMALTLRESAHGALADIEMNNILLTYISDHLGTVDLEILAELSDAMKVPAVMPFGMHQGKPIEEVDPGWISWLRKQQLKDNTPADPYLERFFNGEKPPTLESAQELIRARVAAALPQQLF